MDSKQFSQMMAQLEAMSRLLASILLKDVKTQKDKILRLSSYGFRPVEIAGLLGISQDTVNARLSEARKTDSKRQSATT